MRGRGGSRADVELNIGVLGTFTVEANGRSIPEIELGNRKARLLLKLLVSRHPHHVAMDTLVDVLWPDGAPEKAVENVATLVSRLRGPVGRDVIVGGRSGYRLVLPPGCSVDVDRAEALVAKAQARIDAGQPALAATAAAHAIEILGAGTAMQEEADAGDWLEEYRRTIDRLVRRARAAGWRANDGIGEHRRALDYAEAAIAADRFDEEAHRAVMLAYHRLGEPGEALSAYERVRSALIEELGANPGPETEELYLSILRDEQVATGGPSAPWQQASAPVVGRESEMDALTQAWETAARGAPTCVVVSGESGIGKTHLVEALMSDVASTGAVAVLTRCYVSEQSLFLQPVVEVLHTLAGTLPADLVEEAAGPVGSDLVRLAPELTEIIDSSPREATTPEMERRRIFDALASFLTVVSHRRPLLIAVDDLHNAGASTTELLHFALRWDRTAPLMVAATVQDGRSTEVDAHLADVATPLALGPLSEDAVRRLAREAGHPELAPQLIRLTGGHSLFVLEALSAAAEGGGLVIPDSLRDTVCARVRRCGDDVEELLRAAVVVGAAFEVDHLAELLGLSAEAAVRRCERALKVGLLKEAGAGFEFANEIIRDVLYDTTPEPTRVLRHRRIAYLLSGRPEAAAGHAAAAGDWEHAVRCWSEAAERSLSAFANKEAEALLDRAVDGCTMVGEPALTARVRLQQGRALLGQARYEEATQHFAAAQTLARAMADTDLEGAALEALAWCAYHARQMDRARTLTDRALDHPAVSPRAQILSGRLHNTRGDLTAAVGALELAAADADPVVRFSAQSYLGTALAHSDRFSEAMDVLDSAVAGCELAGLLRPMFNAGFFMALTRANRGDLAGALDTATKLTADVNRYEIEAYRSRVSNVLSFLWRELGQPERARDLAFEGLESARLPDGYLEAEPDAHARLGLAESYLQLGDQSKAAQWLDELNDTVLASVAFGWRVEVHRLDLRARLDPASGEELLTHARRYGSAKYGAFALSHLGRAVDAAELATTTGSDLLVAHVAPEPAASAAAERIAARLPAAYRSDFLDKGRWRSSRPR